MPIIYCAEPKFWNSARSISVACTLKFFWSSIRYWQSSHMSFLDNNRIVLFPFTLLPLRTSGRGHICGIIFLNHAGFVHDIHINLKLMINHFFKTLEKNSNMPLTLLKLTFVIICLCVRRTYNLSSLQSYT